VKHLKSKRIDITSNMENVKMDLELFSLGTPPNYMDDFPISIVRFTGVNITIANTDYTELELHNLYIAILKKNQIQEVLYIPISDLSSSTLYFMESVEIKIDGKEISEILLKHTEEIGKFVVESSEGYIVTNPINGDEIEKELKKLNNNTKEAYQNWTTNEFLKLSKTKDQVPEFIATNKVLRDKILAQGQI